MAHEVFAYQMTKPAIVLYPHVVVPRRENTKLNIESRFECDFVFPEDHPDFAPLKALLAKAMSTLEADGRKVPLVRGDKRAEADTSGVLAFLKGQSILKAHSNLVIKAGPKKGQDLAPPRLVVVINNEYVRYADEERILAKKFFYSGVMAIGTFGIQAYEGMGGGCTVFLNEILSLNVGDKINTGVDDETKYGAPTQYIGKLSSVNPTIGADEISY